MLADSLLPPIHEAIAEASIRLSSVAVTVAGAFAEHLISRFDLPQYLALLRAARASGAEPDAAFESVYHRPLAIADRDWRRQLEARAPGQAGVCHRNAAPIAPVANPVLAVRSGDRRLRPGRDRLLAGAAAHASGS